MVYDKTRESVKSNKTIYLCGDFNVDLLKQAHVYTDLFLETLYSYGMLPIITKPTRITSTTATLIDNIFTNNCFQTHYGGLLCTDISDHLPIFSICNIRGIHRCTEKEYKYIRKYDAQNMSRFKQNLTSKNWEDVLSCQDVDVAYDLFLDMFKDSHECCFPKCRVLINKNERDKPWLTKSLINACKKKNKLYRDFVKKNGCKKAEEKYKKYKNKLTSVIKFAEKQYYSDVLEKNNNNIKATWDIVNSIIKKKSTQSSVPNTFVYEGKIFKGHRSIADGFNDFFVNVGPNFAKQMPLYDNKDIVDYMNTYNDKSMFLLPVTEDEVKTVVNGCKNKVSTDSDDISMNLLKGVFDFVIKPFTYICNLSFVNGVFPNNMKTVKVVPLFKSGSKSNFSNYRPVSILSQFSKKFKKIV